MAGVFIEVDTQQLQRDEEALAEKLGQLQQSLKVVYGLVEELDAMWDGPANQMFKQRFMSDREHFEAACQEVQELIESFGFARSEYNKCEDQVNAAVAAIKI